MNNWLFLVAKVGEKLLANRAKQTIWNNPNKNTSQKQLASNLIDAASLTKDIYDMVYILNEYNTPRSTSKEKSPNE